MGSKSGNVINHNTYLNFRTLSILRCRHAYNIQIREVNVFVTKAIVEFPLRGQSSIEPPQYLAKFKRVSCAAFSLIVTERITLVSFVFDEKYVLSPLALD